MTCVSRLRCRLSGGRADTNPLRLNLFPFPAKVGVKVKVSIGLTVCRLPAGTALTLLATPSRVPVSVAGPLATRVVLWLVLSL